MSQQNVEVVQRGWAAFLSGGTQATLDGWTEDCVFEEFQEMPDSGRYVGHAGVLEAVQHFTEAWGDLTFEPLEFIDVGDDQVIAVVGYRGRGRSSGAPMKTPVAWLYHLRDGRIARARAFISKQQALEAAGLPD
jgi:ketosteroid isomerase-like protein